MGGDEVHNCNKVPKVEVVRSIPRTSPQVDAPTEFDDIVIPNHAAPQAAPVARPVEAPQTRPSPPAAAPAKPRPAPGLADLRPHPATNVNKNPSDRRDAPKPDPTVSPTMETTPHLTA